MGTRRQRIVRNSSDENDADKSYSSLNKGKRDVQLFQHSYTYLCKLHNITPSSRINDQARRSMLDVWGDRLKIDEWLPIIEALKHDKSLHFIAIRSRHSSKKVMEDVNTETKARGIKKQPILLTKFVLQLLMHSLGESLAKSTSLTCIEIEGLPLTKEYITILCNGISANSSLRTLSFCNSPIGDEGCKPLCALLRITPSIFHLDLSNCDLSIESIVGITEMLKYQNFQRFAESWKQSLRYCEPNIESMTGLRRIILNNNVRIGDEGVKKLTEVLKEDLWIRAIDLQNCGIGNEGAQNILDILDINNTLCIVDVRDNKCIDDMIIHAIMLKLFHNNANKIAHEYNWIVPRSQFTNTFLISPFHLKARVLAKCDSSVKSNLSMEYLPLRNMRENIKNMNTQNSVLNIHKKKRDLKYDNHDSNIQENLPILEDQNHSQSYCLMNQEVYDAVLEILQSFQVFIQNLKQNEMYAKKQCRGDGDHANTSCQSEKEFFIIGKVNPTIALSSTQNICIPLEKLSEELSG